jgi:hypothetical protein
MVMENDPCWELQPSGNRADKLHHSSLEIVQSAKVLAHHAVSMRAHLLFKFMSFQHVFQLNATNTTVSFLQEPESEVEFPESSGQELFDEMPDNPDDAGDVKSAEKKPDLPGYKIMKTRYQDLFPDFSPDNILQKDTQFLPDLPVRSDARDLQLVHHTNSHHVAVGAKLYAADVSKRTFTILLEEKMTIGEQSHSTFLLMDIVKLFAAPFVAVLYTPVGVPMSKGMGGSGKTGVSGPAGAGLGGVMYMIIAFPLGLILGILVANMLTEALTYAVTWQVQGGVLRRIPKQISDGIVSKLNDYMSNAAAPTMRDIVKNLLIDVLSDTISNSLHHTLLKSLTDRMSSTLTPATMREGSKFALI